MPERTSYTQGTPNWVDLQTTDQDAAKAFYAGLFGWTYDDQPMPDGQVYSMAMLGGHTVAAIAPQPPDMAAAGAPPMWNTYLAVDSVDDAAAKVEAGGRQDRDGAVRRDGRRADGLRHGPVRRAGGAVAGQPAHRRHPGQRARHDQLERADHHRPGARSRSTSKCSADHLHHGHGRRGVHPVRGGRADGRRHDPAARCRACPTTGTCTSRVADADATAAKVTELGGSVLVPPFDTPVGRIAVIARPAGRGVQHHQASAAARLAGRRAGSPRWRYPSPARTTSSSSGR